MSEKRSFGEMLDNWTDKAGEFLDNLHSNDNGYTDRLKDATARLDSAARASKDEVRESMRQAGKDLKEETKDITDRLDNWLEEIQERARRSGDITKEQLERFKERARRFKMEVEQDAGHMDDEIKGRSERFSDGIDRILDDLRRNNAAGGRNVTGTSPIDHEGDYDAANMDGTINNYQERLDTHTEATKERIRGLVDETEENFRERLDDLTRKY